MRFGSQMLNQRSRQSRLANARLAGQQYYLANTTWPSLFIAFDQHRSSKSSSS